MSIETIFHSFEVINCVSLGKFVEDMELIGPEQAGFRSGYSTVDHIFVLNFLIDFYLFRKKRLYACFIDYKRLLTQFRDNSCGWSFVILKYKGNYLM